MDGYQGQERRKFPISEELIDHIAEKAAEKAFSKVYEQVGKSVLNRLAWLVGAIVIGLFIWLANKGFIKE
ncbi:MAG TPA: hypothetical protein VJ184_13090 [Chryseolinea sp.]|nr:hypothetical protein [Chryseolinea sp.]